MKISDLKQIAGIEQNEPIELKSGVYDGLGEIIHAECGIIMSEADTVLCNAVICGNISISGDNSVVRGCTMKAENAVISVEPKTQNILIAQNEINGEISIRDNLNCSVVLNNAERLTVTDSTSVAVAACKFCGEVRLCGNDYLICDDNEASLFYYADNTNTNGNNITNVNARCDCGANEDILPHVNKELFVGMPKRRSILDRGGLLEFNEYIRREASEKNVVVVPPGAYEVDSELILETMHSNTKIYAYGVYQEKTSYMNILAVNCTENIEIYGLTSGYVGESCGQAHVLEIIDDKSFIIIPAAGWRNDFGKSNLTLYHRAEVNTYREGIIFPWGDLGDYTLERIDDRRLKIDLNPDRSTMVGRIKKGDVLSCRLAGNNSKSILIVDSHNVLLRDCTLYGYAAALAILAYGDNSAMRAERWIDTVKAAPIIDEATYLEYKMLEKKYGIGLEIYIDKNGKYRGAQPRTSSVDATHITGSREGFSATSCVFENMCDDGTNQRASSARLAALTDNGDGTTTVQYKGCATRIYYMLDPDPKGRCFVCSPFKMGDHIFIYASNGKTVCDTHTLSPTKEIGAVEFNITEPPHTKDYVAKIYEVTVPTSDVNFSAIEGYDLSDNHYNPENKAFVDNLDRNSANYTFDNVKMQNARSRCALLKTSGVTIKNCTFRNMLHTGILFSAEPDWGESSVPKDTLIEKCIFDHTGYRNHDFKTRRWSPITVMGMSGDVNDESLVYKNITIRGNRFVNTTHETFAYINAAQKIIIEGNSFERVDGQEFDDNALVLEADTVMDIILRDNHYPIPDAGAERIVRAKNYKNIIVENEVLHGDIE